jgi:hypothetical protein
MGGKPCGGRVDAKRVSIPPSGLALAVALRAPVEVLKPSSPTCCRMQAGFAPRHGPCLELAESATFRLTPGAPMLDSASIDT